MKSVSKQLVLFKKTCLVMLTMCIIIIGYPLLLPIILAAFTYRSIVEQFVKQTNPQFGGILKGLDAVLSARSPYTKPEFVLIPVLYLERSLDKNQLISLFNDRIINAKNKLGRPLYPQLCQRIVRKLGYNFWLNISNFDLQDHIKFFNESNPNQLIKQSDIMELTSEVCDRRFNSERSPWEIILIPRFQHDEDPRIKSVMMFRAHHCLADGFSLLNMFLRMQTNNFPSPYQTMQIGTDYFQQFIFAVRIIIEGPYQILKSMFYNDDNHWLNEVVKNPFRRFKGQQTAFISLQTLKNIKSIWNISVASIMTTIIMQATARSMKRKNVTGNVNQFHVVCPWPLPNHPGGLCNHWSVCKIPINVNILDVEETARNIDLELKRVKSSIIPFSFYMLTNLVGVLPLSWIPEYGSFLKSTSMFSNVPGPTAPYDVGGCKVLDVFVGGSSPRDCAVGCLALSYQGRVRFLVGGDQTNISPVEAGILTEECEKAVEEMVRLSMTG